MAVRLTTYIDDEIASKIKKYDNKSKVMKESLHMYLGDKEYYNYEIKKAENKIDEYKLKLENMELYVDFMQREIEKIDERRKNKPDGYENSVNTLKRLIDVTDEDIEFQAKRLNVSTVQLKEWLWFDGYYDEIFSNNIS